MLAAARSDLDACAVRGESILPKGRFQILGKLKWRPDSGLVRAPLLEGLLTCSLMREATPILPRRITTLLSRRLDYPPLSSLLKRTFVSSIWRLESHQPRSRDDIPR